MEDEDYEYDDESYDSEFEEEEPEPEPMKFADEYRPPPRKPVTLQPPNCPSAFNDLGAVSPKNLGFP
jgi:hypothetical protein